MIPRVMSEFLHTVFPERTWKNRLIADGARRYMEFRPLDVERLRALGIEVDKLGPYLVVCMWDEDSPLEIGGYLVVDNLSMGRPSMGGIRMLPDLTPSAIHNLARGMTLKNAAGDLPYGGGKSGIVAPRDLDPNDRQAVIEGFARLIARYTDVYLPGPDVGTNDSDMRTVAMINGINNALSKTADMGGNRIDQLGAAARSVVVAIETLLEEMPRLQALPQFSDLTVPRTADLSLLIQGFGAVGTHVARIIENEWVTPARVVGISDASGYVFDADGLPVNDLLALQEAHTVAALPYFEKALHGKRFIPTTYSNQPNDLLRETGFCLVPASPVANYLDLDESSGPSMTVDRMGEWGMIVEGANTYSPDPKRKAARARMERQVYWELGVLIATDYLVNSGGVIYAAQEKLIATPPELQIPEDRLGDNAAVTAWLNEHAEAFAALADRRRDAGRAHLERVIRRNMVELVDLLVADSDLLPCEAAEQIAVGRIAASESFRTVADVMAPITTIASDQPVREAARLLISEPGDLLAVVKPGGELVGVVTDWNITHATASGTGMDAPLTGVMTASVVTARPNDSIIDAVRKLEQHEISAMPVVTEDGVIGVVSSDILAQRALLRLLQTQ